MLIDSKKELTPVLYGESAIKILEPVVREAGATFFVTHWHERMELLYLVSGTVQVTLAGVTTAVSAPSLVLIPPGKPHAATALCDQTSYITIMFDLTAFYNKAPASDRWIRPIVEKSMDFVPCTDDTAILAVTKQLVEEYTANTPPSPLIIMGQVYRLLGLFYRQNCCKKGTFSVDKRLNSVLAYIEEHYCEDISSATLCKRFGYTEEYFCRRFKAVTGLTPMNYIHILRLEEAKRRIDEGEKYLSTIFSEVGFSDMSYFSRRFKRYFGMTPREYKQRR